MYQINFLYGSEIKTYLFQNQVYIPIVDLYEIIKSKFVISQKLRPIIKMSYYDEEKDLISVTCESELLEFYRILKLQPTKEMDLKIEIDQDSSSNLEISNNSIPEEKEDLVVTKHDLICDNCKMEIENVRWKCYNCREYNLCSQCEALDIKQHDKRHVFIKLPRKQNNHFNFKPNSDLFYKSENKKNKVKTYNAILVEDSPDNFEIHPEKLFTKVWKIKNIGSTWGSQVDLRWESGDFRVENPIKHNGVVVKDQTIEFSVDLLSSRNAGKYIGYFRLHHKKIGFFGPKFWCSMVVVQKDEEDPNIIYSKQLEKLIFNGFKDHSLNLEALIKFRGDVSQSISYILSKN